MDEFRTIAKLWPSGDEVDLGTDSNVLGGPATFTRNAAGFVTSPDGTQNYQFLFWNTGRHTTQKRRVRWNFSVLGWGTWTATRWYGTPPPIGGGGPARVHAEPFSIAADGPLTGATVIDGPASTYAAGAWPFNGNDHEVGTAGGAATVVAKSPFGGQLFAGWQQLTWGGDPSGEFVENDTGFNANPYPTVNVISGAYNAGAGASADLLATYGTPVDDDPPIFNLRDLLRELLRDRGPWEKPPIGDESPLDVIRKGLLTKLIMRTQPAEAGGDAFTRVLEAAPRMGTDELKRALASVKTSLALGETALAALEAKLKSGGQ